MTPEELTNTEAEIAQAWNDGEINALTHFSGGNEEWLCKFFEENIKPTDWVFVSHRAHFHFLLHGGKDLLEKVKAGKSMFLYTDRFIQSAIVAGNCCIAAGVALSIQKRGGAEKVFCFLGDGAEDEGHFYEAVRFSHEKRLPIKFIIEDNNSSCGVTKEQRGSPWWGWSCVPCVIRHEYKMTYPHAGTMIRPKLKSQTPCS